uniref:Peptidase S1 domain-containing protein n=1 Tax=Glossina pallidipes TaxID=7398 RepID=A0A1A9Z6L0_GLOPL
MFKYFTFFPVIIIVFANLMSRVAKSNLGVELDHHSQTVSQLRRGNGSHLFPTTKLCFIVSLIWYDASEKNGIHHQLGGILTDRIIITSWAPDFSHGKESRGYCVLGFDLKNLGKSQVIPWRTALEKPINFNMESGGYNFTKLPVVSQSLDQKYTPVCKNITEWRKQPKLDAYLFFLANDALIYTRIASLDFSYAHFNRGPVEGVYPFLNFLLVLHNCTDSSTYEKCTRDLCIYKRTAEGSPIIYNDEFHGIYFEQNVDHSCAKGKSMDVVYGSRVNFYAKWINDVKGLLEKDMKKERYSRLTPFVMFYGDEGKNEVLGVMTFLGENFAITDHLDESNPKKLLKVLPGVTKFNGNRIDWSTGIQIKSTSNYSTKTQVTIVELESPVISKRQYKINLPTTLFPVDGSRCEVMTFEKNNKTKILHEMPVLLWDYRQCKKYVKQLSTKQFCIRLDGDAQNRNHCVITSGSPVICNGQVTGIVNRAENRCQTEKPRICTNVFELLDWVLDKVHDEPLSKRIATNIEDIKERMKMKKKKKKNIKKKDDGNGQCHSAVFITRPVGLTNQACQETNHLQASLADNATFFSVRSVKCRSTPF